MHIRVQRITFQNKKSKEMTLSFARHGATPKAMEEGLIAVFTIDVSDTEATWILIFKDEKSMKKEWETQGREIASSINAQGNHCVNYDGGVIAGLISDVSDLEEKLKTIISD
tara:strand:+ start:793 stop:1128 length:336 start_codon:yes stop_codon:yes gene_type:complete